MPNKNEKVITSIKIDGPNVKNGKIDVEDLIVSLQGFQRIYNTISSEISNEKKDKMQISAFREGSFETIIETVKNGATELFNNPIASIASIISIISVIVLVFKKKGTNVQLKDDKSITVNGNDNIVIQLPDLSDVDPKLYVELINRLLQNNKIKKGFSEFTEPLDIDKINEVSLSVLDENLEEKEKIASIKTCEKDFFRYENTINVLTKEMQLDIDEIISLNKTSLNGKISINKKSYPCKFKMNNPEEYFCFFNDKNLSVKCVIEYENLDIEKIKYINIYDIKKKLNT